MEELAVRARIEDWATAGLIDDATADRLRASETARAEAISAAQPGERAGEPPAGNRAGERAGDRPGERAGEPPAEPTGAGHQVDDADVPGRARSLGPAASPAEHPAAAPTRPDVPAWSLAVAAELFAYLGIGAIGFAWYAAWNDAVRSGPLSGIFSDISFSALIAGLLCCLAGFRLLRTTGALGRASGALLLVGGIQIAAGVDRLLGAQTGWSGDAVAMAAAAVWLLAAVVARAGKPALTTQVGLLLAISALAFTSLRTIDPILFGSSGLNLDTFKVFRTHPLQPLTSVAWFCATSLVLALLGEHDARAVPRDPNAVRRATVTRATAGFLAFIGTYLSVKGFFVFGDLVGQQPLGSLPQLAVMTVVMLAVLAASLRTGSVAYFVPTGVAIVIIGAEFNGSYLDEAVGSALAYLFDGLVLLLLTGAALRFRRREEAASPPAGSTA